MNARGMIGAAIMAAALLAARPSSAGEPLRVVASLQPLFSILSVLAHGANVEPIAAPARLPGLAQLPRALGRLSIPGAPSTASMPGPRA